MAKKQVAVTLRKPPQADVDSFVVGGADAPARAPSPVPPAKKLEVVEPARRAPLDEVIVQPDGRAFREMTVYLPNDLARKLSLHCMEADRDVSNVMADFLKEMLEPPPALPAPVDVDTLSALEDLPAIAPLSTWTLGREVIVSLWRNRPWHR